MSTIQLLIFLVCVTVSFVTANMMTNARKRPLVDESKCPFVKPMRHFNLNKIQGPWTVQQYYASSEEALVYGCMRCTLEVTADRDGLEVHMNFSYTFVDDPDLDLLLGNITWVLPDLRQSAHWRHAEDTYKGVYNTYVLDTDYDNWLLLLHCAEAGNSEPRYLSSLLMSRSETPLETGVISYLRDKLSKYGVDLEYLFPMKQDKCTPQGTGLNIMQQLHPAFKSPSSIK